MLFRSHKANPDNKHAPAHGISLEGCSEKVLGQTCNGNNHLKRKAEEELEVFFSNSFHMYLGFLLWP